MRLGVILLAHVREGTLRAVLAQLGRARRHFDLRLVVLLDRPTEGVAHAVARALGPDDVAVPVPFPVVSDRERFGEARNLALDVLDRWRPDWVFVADDDAVLEDGWEEELPRALADSAVDVWFLRSLFFWDEYRVRLDFFPICDPRLWRWRPGARFSDERQLHTPPDLLDNARLQGRTAVLRTRLLDRGFATARDRDVCWRRARRLGKIDAYTTALVTEPTRLVPYEELKAHDGAGQD